MSMFLVNECKSTPETGIILYKWAILGVFFGLFENVKDSGMGVLVDIMSEFNGC
jgi:hypothetical protein